MQRRQMLGALGMGTAAFTVVGASRASAQQAAHQDHGSQIMAQCAEACARAAAHCVEQLTKQSGDAEKHATALRHAAACEKYCILSASESASNSPIAHLAHEANAQACEVCAKACEGIEGQVMLDCVEKCRQCAEHCSQLARQGGQQR